MEYGSEGIEIVYPNDYITQEDFYRLSTDQPVITSSNVQPRNAEYGNKCPKKLGMLFSTLQNQIEISEVTGKRQKDILKGAINTIEKLSYEDKRLNKLEYTVSSMLMGNMRRLKKLGCTLHTECESDNTVQVNIMYNNRSINNMVLPKYYIMEFLKLFDESSSMVAHKTERSSTHIIEAPIEWRKVYANEKYKEYSTAVQKLSKDHVALKHDKQINIGTQTYGHDWYTYKSLKNNISTQGNKLSQNPLGVVGTLSIQNNHFQESLHNPLTNACYQCYKHSPKIPLANAYHPPTIPLAHANHLPTRPPTRANHPPTIPLAHAYHPPTIPPEHSSIPSVIISLGCSVINVVPQNNTRPINDCITLSGNHVISRNNPIRNLTNDSVRLQNTYERSTIKQRSSIFPPILIQQQNSSPNALGTTLTTISSRSNAVRTTLRPMVSTQRNVARPTLRSRIPNSAYPEQITHGPMASSQQNAAQPTLRPDQRNAVQTTFSTMTPTLNVARTKFIPIIGSAPNSAQTTLAPIPIMATLNATRTAFIPMIPSTSNAAQTILAPTIATPLVPTTPSLPNLSLNVDERTTNISMMPPISNPAQTTVAPMKSSQRNAARSTLSPRISTLNDAHNAYIPVVPTVPKSAQSTLASMIPSTPNAANTALTPMFPSVPNTARTISLPLVPSPSNVSLTALTPMISSTLHAARPTLTPTFPSSAHPALTTFSATNPNTQNDAWTTIIPMISSVPNPTGIPLAPTLTTTSNAAQTTFMPLICSVPNPAQTTVAPMNSNQPNAAQTILAPTIATPLMPTTPSLPNLALNADEQTTNISMMPPIPNPARTTVAPMNFSQRNAVLPTLSPRIFTLNDEQNAYMPMVPTVPKPAQSTLASMIPSTPNAANTALTPTFPSVLNTATILMPLVPSPSNVSLTTLTPTISSTLHAAQPTLTPTIPSSAHSALTTLTSMISSSSNAESTTFSATNPNTQNDAWTTIIPMVSSVPNPTGIPLAPLLTTTSNAAQTTFMPLICSVPNPAQTTVAPMNSNQPNAAQTILAPTIATPLMPTTPSLQNLALNADERTTNISMMPPILNPARTTVAPMNSNQPNAAQTTFSPTIPTLNDTQSIFIPIISSVPTHARTTLAPTITATQNHAQTTMTPMIPPDITKPPMLLPLQNPHPLDTDKCQQNEHIPSQPPLLYPLYREQPNSKSCSRESFEDYNETKCDNDTDDDTLIIDEITSDTEFLRCSGDDTDYHAIASTDDENRSKLLINEKGLLMDDVMNKKTDYLSSTVQRLMSSLGKKRKNVETNESTNKSDDINFLSVFDNATATKQRKQCSIDEEQCSSKGNNNKISIHNQLDRFKNNFKISLKDVMKHKGSNGITENKLQNTSGNLVECQPCSGNISNNNPFQLKEFVINIEPLDPNLIKHSEISDDEPETSHIDKLDASHIEPLDPNLIKHSEISDDEPETSHIDKLDASHMSNKSLPNDIILQSIFDSISIQMVSDNEDEDSLLENNYDTNSFPEDDKHFEEAKDNIIVKTQIEESILFKDQDQRTSMLLHGDNHVEIDDMIGNKNQINENIATKNEIKENKNQVNENIIAMNELDEGRLIRDEIPDVLNKVNSISKHVHVPTTRNMFDTIFDSISISGDPDFLDIEQDSDGNESMQNEDVQDNDNFINELLSSTEPVILLTLPKKLQNKHTNIDTYHNDCNNKTSIFYSNAIDALSNPNYEQIDNLFTSKGCLYPKIRISPMLPTLKGLYNVNLQTLTPDDSIQDIYDNVTFNFNPINEEQSMPSHINLFANIKIKQAFSLATDVQPIAKVHKMSDDVCIAPPINFIDEHVVPDVLANNRKKNLPERKKLVSFDVPIIRMNDHDVSSMNKQVNRGNVINKQVNIENHMNTQVNKGNSMNKQVNREDPTKMIKHISLFKDISYRHDNKNDRHNENIPTTTGKVKRIQEILEKAHKQWHHSTKKNEQKHFMTKSLKTHHDLCFSGKKRIKFIDQLPSKVSEKNLNKGCQDLVVHSNIGIEPIDINLNTSVTSKNSTNQNTNQDKEQSDGQVRNTNKKQMESTLQTRHLKSPHLYLNTKKKAKAPTNKSINKNLKLAKKTKKNVSQVLKSYSHEKNDVNLDTKTSTKRTKSYIDQSVTHPSIGKAPNSTNVSFGGKDKNITKEPKNEINCTKSAELIPRERKHDLINTSTKKSIYQKKMQRIALSNTLDDQAKFNITETTTNDLHSDNNIINARKKLKGSHHLRTKEKHTWDGEKFTCRELAKDVKRKRVDDNHIRLHVLGKTKITNVPKKIKINITEKTCPLRNFQVVLENIMDDEKILKQYPGVKEKQLEIVKKKNNASATTENQTNVSVTKVKKTNDSATTEIKVNGSVTTKKRIKNTCDFLVYSDEEVTDDEDKEIEDIQRDKDGNILIPIPSNINDSESFLAFLKKYSITL